jgi:FkbM family methyltransferase
LRLRFGLWGRLRANHHPSFYLSHSQFGEDMVARDLLSDVSRGTFVDVGAHHPVYYSNTYHFYRRGWRGLNVDAAPGTKELFDLLRPGDINIEACVAATPGALVEYFLFNQPALNTTDPATAGATLRRPGVNLLERRAMQTVTLDMLLEQHLPAAKIDLLSIDVEGLDEQLLASHDWTRWRPRVVIFERAGLDAMQIGSDSLVLRLSELGYTVRGKCGPSLILGL